jgi:hypothetical protein
MVRHLLISTRPVSSKWAAIRRIAARLAAEDGNEGANYEHYLEVLTTRAVKYWERSPIGNLCQGRDEPNDYIYLAECECGKSCSQEEYDLMAAAAYTNKLGLMKELISNPTNVNTSPGGFGAFGDPYVTAAAGGHLAALDMVLGSLSPRGQNRTKKSILAQVSRQGSSSMLERCVPEWPKLTWLAHNCTASDLHHALSTPDVDNFEIIMRILEKKPKKQIGPSALATYLDHACQYGWEGVARHLISLGVYVKKPLVFHEGMDTATVAWSFTPTRTWPLRSASDFGNPEIVQLLFDHGAQVQGDEIEEAANRGHWDVVWILAKYGADVNGALCGAVKKEREDVIRELIERGAEVGLGLNISVRSGGKEREGGLDCT